MDKLQLTGQNLGRVFNSRSDCMSGMHLYCYEAKQLNLKLKTQPKQLLGSLPIVFALPVLVNDPFQTETEWLLNLKILADTVNLQKVNLSIKLHFGKLTFW
jgi:hypothetical protein